MEGSVRVLGTIRSVSCARLGGLRDLLLKPDFLKKKSGGKLSGSSYSTCQVTVSGVWGRKVRDRRAGDARENWRGVFPPVGSRNGSRPFPPPSPSPRSPVHQSHGKGCAGVALPLRPSPALSPPPCPRPPPQCPPLPARAAPHGPPLPLCCVENQTSGGLHVDARREWQKGTDDACHVPHWWVHL